MIGLKRLTNIDVFDLQHPVPLEDSALRRFPLLYAVEVGRMALTDAEAIGLRNYLLAGGMLIVDDFWGSLEWANFEREITRVLPELSGHPEAFFIADEQALVYRARAESWEGMSDTYEPAVARMYLSKFESLWNACETEPEVRQLQI